MLVYDLARETLNPTHSLTHYDLAQICGCETNISDSNF